MSNYDSVTQTAQDYYNSKDADEFYYSIWGGEDIHVGIYETPGEPIRDASRRTVDRMLSKLPKDDSAVRVLDLGAGYGGAARQIVSRKDWHVTCLNLSEVQNARNRQRNAELGWSARIDVIDGSFQDVPAEDETFDVVWSEDALLHAPDRRAVLEEAYRVLRPGGSLIFTDPMQQDDCPPGVLQAVYDRIHLDSLASFEYYTAAANAVGFLCTEIEDLSIHLPRHYNRVREELRRRYDEVVELASQAYVDRMLDGLQHWIDAGERGYLAWGILHFSK